MRPLPSLFLAAVLSGCAAVSPLRRGDAAADLGDWSLAYDEYALASARRPGSARAQAALTSARAAVLAELALAARARLDADDFAGAGRVIADAARYAPPPAWLQEQNARAASALSAHLSARLRDDGPVEAAQILYTAHTALPDLPGIAALEQPITDRARADAAALADAGRFREARALLDAVGQRLPRGPSALDAAQADVDARWAAALQASSQQARRDGELGAAQVYAAAARTLLAPDTALWSQVVADEAAWSSLLSASWGGLYLRVRGPAAPRAALEGGIASAWDASPWGALPVRLQRPSLPHLTAAVDITEARCTRQVLQRAQKVHHYTDGTMVDNPDIPPLERQIFDSQRALEDRAAQVVRAAQRLQATEQAAEEARRADGRQRERVAGLAQAAEAAAQRLEAAEAQLKASLDAQAQIVERESEVQQLLSRQRQLNQAEPAQRRALEDARAEAGRTGAALQAAEAAHQDASARAEAAASALAERVAALEGARQALAAADRDSQRLEAALRDGAAALPGLEAQARAAGKERREADAALDAVVSREAPLKQALDSAAAEAQAARQALTELQATEAQQAAALKAATARQDEAAIAELEPALASTRQAIPAAKEAAASAQRARTAAREAHAAAGAAVRDARKKADSAVQAQEAAEKALSDAQQAQDERTAALEAHRRQRDGLVQAVAAAERAVPPAQRAHDEARRAVDAAQQALQPRQQAARAAAAVVERREAALAETRQEQQGVQQRLSQVETEVRTLSASVDLLPARRQEQRAARQQAAETRDALGAGQRTLEQRGAVLAAAERDRQQAAGALTARQQAEGDEDRRLRTLQQQRAVMPALVELVKAAPYTETTWQRRCTLSAAVTVAGQAAQGWSDTIHLEAAEQDATWPGQPRVGLGAEPLAFSVSDEAVAAQQQQALHAALWAGIQRQLPREADALRETTGTQEAQTRAQLAAHWLAPSPALQSFLQARYDLP